MRLAADEIGLVVATTRVSAVSKLLTAVLSQESVPGAVVLIFQGTAGDYDSVRVAAQATARKHRYDGLRCHFDRGRRGASRARNIGFDLLPSGIRWAWTPNDTTLPSDDWIVELERLDIPDNTAALVMNYLVNGRPRRDVSHHAELDDWSIWLALEAATILSIPVTRDHGGFDQRLGTGSSGWAQSGEITDWLARVHRHGHAIVTVPLTVSGISQHAGTTRRARAYKEFYYGVGFGVVARRHFMRWRSLAAIMTPLLSWAIRRATEGDRPSLALAMAASAGRSVGLALGEKALNRVPTFGFS